MSFQVVKVWTPWLRKYRLAVIAVFVMAAAALAAWRLIAGPQTTVYPAIRTDIVQTVVASGRVESPRRVEVGSPVTATVVSIPVEEGQTVKAGQLLIAMDDSETKAAVEQARSGVAEAEAKLRQIRDTSLPVADEAVRQAEANVLNAQRQFERNEDLFGRGFVGQAALDDARRNRDVTQSQLKSAQLQRASESTGGSDRRLAETALAQARAALQAALAKQELMTIEAPASGVLISRNVEKGNVAQPGKALMVLSPSGETQIVVQIDEKNLGYLHLGQKALASADAFPAQRFEAEVAYINPAVDPARGSVEVKLRVARPPSYLLQDMTVSVDVEVARRSGVLALPADAVRDYATTAPWVLVVRDGRALRQSVTLGAKGEGLIEVLAGLAEGEFVVPGSDVKIKEGARLRTGPAGAGGKAKS